MTLLLLALAELTVALLVVAAAFALGCRYRVHRVAYWRGEALRLSAQQHADRARLAADTAQAERQLRAEVAFADFDAARRRRALRNQVQALAAAHDRGRP